MVVNIKVWVYFIRCTEVMILTLLAPAALLWFVVCLTGNMIRLKYDSPGSASFIFLLMAKHLKVIVLVCLW